MKIVSVFTPRFRRQLVKIPREVFANYSLTSKLADVVVNRQQRRRHRRQRRHRQQRRLVGFLLRRLRP